MRGQNLGNDLIYRQIPEFIETNWEGEALKILPRKISSVLIQNGSMEKACYNKNIHKLFFKYRSLLYEASRVFGNKV